MIDLSLRKIGEADLPVLLSLYGQPSFNNGRIVSLDEARAIFARFAAYPDYAIYFAEGGGEVLGSFALTIIDNIAHWGTPTAMIENVVVREDQQSQGIGRAMMNAACDLARTKGAYKVTLSSNLRNERGHAFYEGLGFEKHGFSFRLELAQAERLSSLVRDGWEGNLPLQPFGTEATPVVPSPAERGRVREGALASLPQSPSPLRSEQDPLPTSPACAGEGKNEASLVESAAS